MLVDSAQHERLWGIEPPHDPADDRLDGVIRADFATTSAIGRPVAAAAVLDHHTLDPRAGVLVHPRAGAREVSGGRHQHERFRTVGEQSAQRLRRRR